MYILHEVVEMDARLGLDVGRQGLVEQIHEHRLPAPHITIHIQSLGEILGDLSLRLCALAPKQRAEERRLGFRIQRLNAWVHNGRRSITFQHVVQVLQLLDNLLALSAHRRL